MGASAPDQATQVWDLAEWVKPFSSALLGYTMNTLIPTNIYTVTKGGETYASQGDIDRLKAIAADPNNPQQKDAAAAIAAWGDLKPLPKNFNYEGAGSSYRTWGRAPGPPDQEQERFSVLEGEGQKAALDVYGNGNPLQAYANQFAANRFAGGEQSLADQQLAYILGGPLAGATRSGMLDQLEGPGSQYSEQALLDTLYGKSASAADQAMYTLLGSDREATREGLHRAISGPEANLARTVTERSMGGPEALQAMLSSQRSMGGNEAELARRTSAATMRGDYLSPETNPYLDATYKRAAGAMTDQYRDAVAPQLAAQFARAGSFGGSAHQDTEASSRYNFGRNLEELATGIYGENYGKERDRQLNVAGQERGFSESAINRERGFTENAAQRERGFTESAIQNRLQQEVAASQGLMQQRAAMAESERSGGRQVLTGERNLQAQMTQSTMERLMQLTGMVPGIRAADYADADVLRTIGREYTELGRENRGITRTNALQKHQWPLDLISLLSGGIGGAIGNSGTSTSTGGGGSGNTAAQLGGGGLALLSLLASTQKNS